MERITNRFVILGLWVCAIRDFLGTNKWDAKVIWDPDYTVSGVMHPPKYQKPVLCHLVWCDPHRAYVCNVYPSAMKPIFKNSRQCRTNSTNHMIPIVAISNVRAGSTVISTTDMSRQRRYPTASEWPSDVRCSTNHSRAAVIDVSFPFV